jgi:pyocin large subunit-like protein
MSTAPRKPRTPFVRSLASLATWIAALLALAALHAWVLDAVAAPAANARVASTSVSIHSDVGFRDHDHLVQHYRKHGREFGRITMAEYLRLAQTLRDRPAGGPILESVRSDRVVTRFDRSSGAFIAFDSDLTIRTFFRPNQGETYFRRQAQRSAEWR